MGLHNMLLPFLKESLIIVAILSGGPLLCSSIFGLIVSIIQSVTQVQEQSITYCVKFFTLAGLLAFLGEWGGEQLIQYTQEILIGLSAIGRSP